MAWELFLGATITSFIFLLVGLIWKRFPPKKINHFYGYRTRRSMANQEVWDCANSLGARMFIYLGLILLVISLFAYFFFPYQSPIISLFAMLLGIGIGMFWCETQLNIRFDRNGHPKN